MTNIKENPRYLKEQLITYIGNKRTLIPYIEEEVNLIKSNLNKDKLNTVDLFSGSGAVARMLKAHSNKIIVNDLEGYSKIINECYLSNKCEFDIDKYNNYLKELNILLEEGELNYPLISKHFAPKDDKNIQIGERVIYTTENAKRIDIIREFINTVEEDYKKYFLAQLLYKASVHTNTSGIFKGFYKDKETGIGKYGGSGENALNRIKSTISIDTPILSNFEVDYEVYQKDANELVKELGKEVFDLVYLDPPYNQHPYSSNYFMLNTIVNQSVDIEKLSVVSGIPSDWNRSKYNKKKEALDTFNDLISNIKAHYILVSYNSEGFISFEDMKNTLSNYGTVEVKEINYNTYRGSRNLKNRNKYVTEYIFKLKKNIF